MKIVLFFLFAMVIAQHDHGLHVDTGFISGEARRIGWLAFSSFLRDCLANMGREI